MAAAADDREQEQRPANKMTREEAERLRELLRGKPADLADPAARQRVGSAITWAIDRQHKRHG